MPGGDRTGPLGRGPKTGRGGTTGQGRYGRGIVQSADACVDETNGKCVCPQCGHKEPHKRGTPCSEHICPKCGTAMTRE